MPSGQGPTPARAKALTGAGGIAWWQEDMPAAQVFYEEASGHRAELGDPPALPRRCTTRGSSWAPGVTSTPLCGCSRKAWSYSAARATRPGWLVEWMIVIRDLIAGDLDGTVARAEEAVATWRRVGDRFHLGDGLVWLAVLYARRPPGGRPVGHPPGPGTGP